MLAGFTYSSIPAGPCLLAAFPATAFVL